MFTPQAHITPAPFNSLTPLRVASARPHYNTKPESEGDVTRRFGLRLRQLRRDRNLTQMQMARRFGIDRSYISEVERGRKSISLVTLELIALGFRMSLSDVMVNI